VGAERKYDRAVLVPLICARLATGKDPMTVICRELDVPIRTVNQWREDDVEIALQFDEAREVGYDAIAADCLEIADTPQIGIEETISASGAKEIRKGDMLQHRKLRIDTRIKLLAKWDPRRYGDRLALANDRKDPLITDKPTRLTEEQLLSIAMKGVKSDG
jgi:hypothetical protein